MRYSIYTLAASDMEAFYGLLPSEVTDSVGKRGYFVIGAVDDDYTLISMAEFFIGITSEGECDAEVVYVYVKEPYRGQGVASQMIGKIHRILKKSGVGKSVALLDAEEIREFFKENGYILMKVDEESGQFLRQALPERETVGKQQGIHWIK